MYEAAVERLAALGIARYEISNFARPGSESRHNLKYWKLEPYVGFGADAHSFDGSVRHRQPGIGGGLRRRHRRSRRGPASHENEHLFIGLRLSAGIRPTSDDWRRFDAPIHRFLEAGPARNRTAASCGSPTAACCCPTKSSRSF